MRRPITAFALLGALVTGILCAGIPSAAALDQPISATKIVAQRKNGKEKLSFTSKDAAFLFPAIGSPDDPGTGTPGGMLIELLSETESTATLGIPPGAGNPGWAAKTGSIPTHQFKNKLAPSGISPVKVAILKQGKVLKLVAKQTGLTLTTPTTRLAIRITTGALRSCAVFTSFKKNEGGRIIGTNAPAPAIADCSNASLLPVPAPCGDTNPTCNGTCPVGEECASFGFASPNNSCGCLPTGSTPCGTPNAPTCGGACPTGTACSAVFPSLAIGGGPDCNCQGPGTTCTNGFAWGGAPEEGFPFACYPLLCGGSYPTCGGSCLDGGSCDAFIAGAFTGCICSAPAACGGGGFQCAPGTTCHAGGPLSCGPP